MDELIELLSSKLGIDATTASSGAGKLLAMVKAYADEDTFGQIAGAIPGVEEAVAAGGPAAAEASGGGMLGKLAGMVSGALGGEAGGGIEIASALAGSGIDTEKLGPFISTVVDFLRDKVGDEVLEQVLAKFPMLKSLLG